ncbi:MAG: aspartate-semialdehyde dehydrogenase [Candidatus Hecatellales archaeon]|nr:MAG: aspartate-semialdehyde dehydrogenase [Candidatus Hecatellales archaeon]
MVGARFISLLSSHPWFELKAVAASERSRGQRLREAVRWLPPEGLPEEVLELEVRSPKPRELEEAEIVFSALPSEVAGSIEEEFAGEGFAVFSNASSHRMDEDVPILNPEVNADHASMVEVQRKRRKWEGFIVTNPNCTAAVLTLSLKPIQEEFGIRRVIVSTMQALSGAGYPGVSSLDILDNVIPYIRGEEEKVERETLKMMGAPFKPASFKISASCHRVPTLDGHLEAVFVELERQAKPSEVAEAMASFEGEPQRLKLPTAPKPPIVVRGEEDRPQPRLDRMEGRGMAVVVGRVREDRSLGGVKYLVLGHNTIRGAAGCSVLNAELFAALKLL